MRPRISEEYSQQQRRSKLCLSTILYSTTCCSQPVTTSSRIDTFVVTRVTSSGLPGQDLTIRWGIRLSRGQTKCQGLINPFRRQFNYLCDGICPSHEINTGEGRQRSYGRNQVDFRDSVSQILSFAFCEPR